MIRLLLQKKKKKRILEEKSYQRTPQSLSFPKAGVGWIQAVYQEIFSGKKLQFCVPKQTRKRKSSVHW